jgi:hypothetical protein
MTFKIRSFVIIPKFAPYLIKSNLISDKNVFSIKKKYLVFLTLIALQAGFLAVELDMSVQILLNRIMEINRIVDSN